MKTKITLLALAFLGLINNASAQKKIAGGSYFSFAVCGDGTVKGWGLNGSTGRLGDGTSNNSSVPVAVSSITDITTVVAGNDHGVALKSDGTVWSWGRNQEGRLGDGTTTNSNIPVQATGLTGVVAIAAGSRHTLALKGDGTVWSIGYNLNGELGDGTNTDRSIAVQVNNLTNIIAIASMGINSVALKSDGTVWTWGDNAQGQLGNGNTGTDSNIPVQVSGLTNVIAITGGGFHSIALKNDGTAWAWGYNGDGRLGNGTTTSSNVPVQISNLTGIISLGAGANGHSLFLKNDGTAWACGGNASGQLGNGTTTNSNVPVQVSSLTDVTEIAGGFTQSLFLKNDGTLWACGGNLFGELGDGTTTSASSPVQVTGLCAVSVGINEIKEQGSISIYPNPSNGVFQITSDKLQFENLEIYNAIGEKIYTSKSSISNSIIDISTQPKGIFLVKMYEGNTAITKRIVIQ